MVKKVGRYELGRTLGEGRFGKVKFAVNVETGESAAIKMMGKDVIVRLNSVERVKREIAIMKTIHHQHVVKLVEVLSSPERIYIVMELLSGGELFHKLATMRRFTEAVTRRYFRQLISGLSYCHSKKVYHRDLKPENLLLDDDDNLKISDFGLSALLASDSSLCHTLCGTPNYVAPDVLQETGRGYDPASADVWSCGVILYVFLSGKLPFDEPTNEALYAKILSANFQIPSHFSPGARNLVKRVLDPSPITRYTIEMIQQDPWFKDNTESSASSLRTGKEEKEGEGSESAKAEDGEVKELNSLESFIPTEEEPDDQELSMAGTTITNAFELIAVSGALDLTRLLQGKRYARKPHTQFCSRVGRMEVYRRVREVLSSFNYQVQIFDQKFFISGFNRHGLLRYNVAIMHISTEWHLISFSRDRGNILEFNEFFRAVFLKCEDIVWERDPIKTRIKEWNNTASRPSISPPPNSTAHFASPTKKIPTSNTNYNSRSSSVSPKKRSNTQEVQMSSSPPNEDPAERRKSITKKRTITLNKEKSVKERGISKSFEQFLFPSASTGSPPSYPPSSSSSTSASSSSSSSFSSSFSTPTVSNFSHPPSSSLSSPMVKARTFKSEKVSDVRQSGAVKGSMREQGKEREKETWRDLEVREPTGGGF